MFNYKSETGLTIIEALIAILIFSMIASSLLFVNRQSVNITNDSKMRNTALNLARERIESLKYLDRNDSINILTRNSPTWVAIDKVSETKELNSVQYTITTSIENTNNSNIYFKDSKIVPIRVTVVWNNNGGITGRIFLDTCFTQY